MMEPRENVQAPVDPGRLPASTENLNNRLRASIDIFDARLDTRSRMFRCLGCGFGGEIITADIERHRSSGCLGTTEPIQVGSSLSIAEAEEFFSSPDARVVGVDMPGVGHVGRAPATAPGRDYVAGDVPESLRRFLDGDRIDLEITPAGVIALQQLAEEREEPEELYGEPWRMSVDALDHVHVFDSEGTRVCLITSESRVEALEWAERICACVNFCSGLPEFDLAFSESLTKRFPFLRESCPSIQNAIVESLKSAVRA